MEVTGSCLTPHVGHAETRLLIAPKSQLRDGLDGCLGTSPEEAGRLRPPQAATKILHTGEVRVCAIDVQ